MALMKVGDVNIEYYVEGKGTPLLMLGGVGSHAGTWGEPFLTEMRRRFRIIRPSNRGMGASDVGSGPLTQRVMADETAYLMRELGIESASVFGYSMGGYIAQELALNYPQTVQQLVLGCTNCGPRHSVPQSPQDLARVAQFMADEDRVRGFCMMMVTEHFAQREAETMENLISLHRSGSAEAFGRQMMAIGAFDSYDRLSRVESETLIIHGDEDIVIAPGNAGLLAQHIPNARIQTISGVGHMFMWERPEETAIIIERFLGPTAKPH